jgi:hypothetical protein
MHTTIPTFEPVTELNIDARRYLAANRDLRKAFGNDEVNARRHFFEYGFKENRRQLTAEFVSDNHRVAKAKLFKAALSIQGIERFPVQVGASIYSLEDYAAESSNAAPSFWKHELETNSNKLYADIGAGVRDSVRVNCVYVEVYPSVTADLLIDQSCALPFSDASLDGIGCFAVLEHAEKPWKLASEFGRVVRPGGKIFIDWPFLQPVHGFPSHYFNATREGLRSLFADSFYVDSLFTGPYQGPDFTVSWILNTLIQNIKDESIRDKFTQMTVGNLCDEATQGAIWSMILSSMDDSVISTLSCGNTLIGIKK